MKSKKNLWSVFLTEHFNKDKWIKSYSFYYGDCSNWDFKNDWRTSPVKNKRKLAVFIGLVNTDFPIKWPLKLNCGKILHKL